MSKPKQYNPEKVKYTCHHGISHLGNSFCERCLKYAMGDHSRKRRKVVLEKAGEIK